MEGGRGVEREEEDGWMVLFPFILLQRKKKKMGLKEKKMMEEMNKWVLSNEVMGLPIGVWVFIKWVMNVVVFISWVMNIMK